MGCMRTYHGALSFPRQSDIDLIVKAGSIIAQEAGGIVNTSDLSLHGGEVTGDISDKVLTGRKYVVMRCGITFLLSHTTLIMYPLLGLSRTRVSVNL